MNSLNSCQLHDALKIILISLHFPFTFSHFISFFVCYMHGVIITGNYNSMVTNPRQVWSTIDKILCRQKSTTPTTQLTADSFATFFAKKIEDIRSTTENAPPATFTDNPSDGKFTTYKLLDTSDVTSLILKSPLKQCALDPIPTWLLKDCIDLLAPYITSVFNISLSSGYVPSSFKDAYITPLLKKSGLDETTVGNYRPVSNLYVCRKHSNALFTNLSEGNLLHIPSIQEASFFQSMFGISHLDMRLRSPGFSGSVSCVRYS